MKSKCGFGVECYGGNHHGENGAGPSEDFDSCIKTCDKGAYTQNCINKCFKEVYGETAGDNDLSANTNSINNIGNLVLSNAFTEKYNNFAKIASIPTYGKTQNGNYISSKCTFSGDFESVENGTSCMKWVGKEPYNGGATAGFYYILETEHGVRFQYHEACATGQYLDDDEIAENGKTVTCYEVIASSKKCSMDPVKDFILEVNQASNEYAKIEEFMNNYQGNVADSTKKENYSISIKEKYGDPTKEETSVFAKKGGDYTISYSEVTTPLTGDGTYTKTVKIANRYPVSKWLKMEDLDRKVKDLQK